MSARDEYHDIVRTALEKEGWTITHDPLTIPARGFTNYHIDIGAEMMLAAERNGEKIAVEIKSFLGTSFANEFHAALGQFLNYFIALRAYDKDRTLYMAVPEDIYKSYFFNLHMQEVLEELDLSLIVFDPTEENIVKWKN